MGVYRCVYKNCPSVQDKGSNLVFFGFPKNDPERLTSWMRNSGVDPDNVTKSMRLCQLHFKEDDILPIGTRLNKDAVPQPFLEHAQEEPTEPDAIEKVEEEVTDTSEPNLKRKIEDFEKPAKKPRVAASPPKIIPATSSKEDLFHQTKKYINPVMGTLLGMELFASADYQWTADEKELAVKLIAQGESVYNFCRDELRFRLPAIADARSWAAELRE